MHKAVSKKTLFCNLKVKIRNNVKGADAKRIASLVVVTVVKIKQ